MLYYTLFGTVICIFHLVCNCPSNISLHNTAAGCKSGLCNNILGCWKIMERKGKEKALWIPAIIICSLYTFLNTNTLEVSSNWMSIIFFHNNIILNNKLLAIKIRHKFLINICHSLTLQYKGFSFLDDWVNGNCCDCLISSIFPHILYNLCK